MGTGYFGRSSIGDNIGPQHLVHWTKVAYHRDENVAFGNYHKIGKDFPGPLPEAEIGGLGLRSQKQPAKITQSNIESLEIRNEIRRLISEELKDLLGKNNG